VSPVTLFWRCGFGGHSRARPQPFLTGAHFFRACFYLDGCFIWRVDVRGLMTGMMYRRRRPRLADRSRRSGWGSTLWWRVFAWRMAVC